MSADAYVTDADMKKVADAIRTKGNTTGLLQFPNGMVDAINGIQTGGSGPFIGFNQECVRVTSNSVSNEVVRKANSIYINQFYYIDSKGIPYDSYADYELYPYSELTMLWFKITSQSEANGYTITKIDMNKSMYDAIVKTIKDFMRTASSNPDKYVVSLGLSDSENANGCLIRVGLKNDKLYAVKTPEGKTSASSVMNGTYSADIMMTYDPKSLLTNWEPQFEIGTF